MTQPPDDLERRPDGSVPDDATTPDGPTAPENQPTVAWTPPDQTPPQPSSSDVPTPDAPPPDAPPPAPSWDAAAPRHRRPRPGIARRPAPGQPDHQRQPVRGARPRPGWQQPPPAAPVVAWETPGPSAAAPGREGYVIGGMGARLVAYFLDSIIVAIVPTILTLFVTDYGSIFQQAIDASRNATPGQINRADIVVNVTPELILVTLIGLAIQYIYFVGFWTSDGHATPGMRGLRMQVVDAATGGTLSLTAATKRFIALGYPLSLAGHRAGAAVGRRHRGVRTFAVPVLHHDHQRPPPGPARQVREFAGHPLGHERRRRHTGRVPAADRARRRVRDHPSAVALAALGPQIEELMREVGNSI